MKSKRDTDKVNFTWSDVLDSIEAFNKILYNLISYIFFKGDPLHKDPFHKVFEHSYVVAVCENNQPINVKNPQTIF